MPTNCTLVGRVNEALARRFWPDESPLGQRVRIADGRSYEVVGVASDHKIRSVGEDARPYIHFVRAQRFNAYAMKQGVRELDAEARRAAG